VLDLRRGDGLRRAGADPRGARAAAGRALQRAGGDVPRCRRRRAPLRLAAAGARPARLRDDLGVRARLRPGPRHPRPRAACRPGPAGPPRIGWPVPAPGPPGYGMNRVFARRLDQGRPTPRQGLPFGLARAPFGPGPAVLLQYAMQALPGPPDPRPALLGTLA